MRKHLYPEYAHGPGTGTGGTGEAAQDHQRGGRRRQRRDAGGHIGYSAWAS
jgi:hypothetical protein